MISVKKGMTGSGMGMPLRVSLDIETFSSEDLSHAGVCRYAEAPDFCVVLLG